MNCQAAPCLPHPGAAQGEVDVIPEPAPQGDVPALPELGHRAGDIGIVKVLLKAEAEHAPQADGHVGIAGKVKIDLQAVAQRAQPGHGRRELPRPRQGEGPLRRHGEVVGQQDLLGKAQNKALDPLLEALRVHAAASDLLRHAVVAHDGAGDELGEKGDVQPQIQDVALHLSRPPVHVDAVGERLEGEKGNADGQAQPHRFHAQPQQGVQVFNGEVQILEGEEDPQVQRHGQDQQRLFPAALPGVDPPPQEIVCADGKEHQKNVDRLPPGIEKQARPQQKQVARPLSPQQVVAQQHRGEKDEEKDGA